jgi:hypothetical protein
MKCTAGSANGPNNMITKTKTMFVLALFALLMLQCKNPFKSDDPKKQRIIILINNEYLTDTGRYVAFWNGKDSNGKYVAAGKYIILMEAKNFNDQNFVTAQEGGKNEDNNNQHVEPGFWSHYELEAAFPNPFKIQSGVNIPFLVPEIGRVRITIYKD